MLGLAGASLAVLLGADRGTVIVTGVATSLGLVVRQELGRRHFSLLTLPFAGGFVGAVLGGIAIRLGWTRTPGLALIVPSLMLVPGPHLINGLLDLVDNYVPMSIARLALAASILVAIALGVVLGIELTLPDLPMVEQNPNVNCPNVVLDVLLAAVVTIGFALYYNTDWGHIGIATAGGMAGHGLRFLALESGWGLVPATFLGGVAVGLVAAWASRSYKVPIAVMAFAGAVTMMPGVQIYRALSGSLRLARQDEAAGLPLIAGTLGDAFQACLIVIALAIGLIISSRFVLLMAREKSPERVARPVPVQHGPFSITRRQSCCECYPASHERRRGAHLGIHACFVLLEVVDEQTGEFLGGSIVGGLIRPGVTRPQDLGWHAGAVGDHVEAKHRIALSLTAASAPCEWRRGSRGCGRA